MATLNTTIPLVREAVVSILRLTFVKPASTKKGKAKGKPKATQVRASLAGSAFCVLADRYLVTAHHIFNEGKSRVAKDKFYAFVVPGNGDPAYHFPVIGFPLERPDVDLAVLEIGPCIDPQIHLPAVPVSFASEADGTRVVTVGFPAPEISSLSLDPNGNYLGGQFLLKSHANEGIVSAQYVLGGHQFYELNVGWHHGESGGPVVRLDDPPCAFAVMQEYRGIKSPHGVVVGPHRGRALSVIAAELKALGVVTVP